MLRLVLSFALLVSPLALGLELQEGAPYRIQSVADGFFLNVLREGTLCKPLSGVNTVESAMSATIWYPNWWGNVELFGVHFDSDRSMNTVTFEGGPTCYPVYHAYELVSGGGDGTQIRLRDSNLCLTSEGTGQLVDFKLCEEGGQANQAWNFVKVLRN